MSTTSPIKNDHRSAYDLERALADQLRNASKADRRRLTREVYAEIARHDHSHGHMLSPAQVDRYTAGQAFSYLRWIAGASSALEIGAGEGYLSAHLAAGNPNARIVVTDVVPGSAPLPVNASFVQAEGWSLPFADESFDFVYSSQVVEHIHPQDVLDHFCDVLRLLRPGGCYGFDTPSGLTGPHDVSRGFTSVATGLHLKEWTYGEISPVLRAAGFRMLRTRLLPGRVARTLKLRAPGPVVPVGVRSALEQVARLTPRGPARDLVCKLFGLDGLYVFAMKPFGPAQQS